MAEVEAWVKQETREPPSKRAEALIAFFEADGKMYSETAETNSHATDKDRQV